MARLRSSSGPSTAAPGSRAARAAVTPGARRRVAPRVTDRRVRTIFAFDTATSLRCALVRDGEPVGERAPSAPATCSPPSTSCVRPASSRASSTRIVVGTGPGSFTSSGSGSRRRAGSRSRSACRWPASRRCDAFAGGTPVIDARRGEVFTDRARASARPEELDVAGARLVGDGAVRYRDVFEAARRRACRPTTIRAHLPARAPARRARRRRSAPAERVEPLYLRAPDAKPSR